MLLKDCPQNLFVLISGMEYFDKPIVLRKAFPKASAQGLAVTEIKPQDPKAIEEVTDLYKHAFSQQVLKSTVNI